MHAATQSSLSSWEDLKHELETRLEDLRTQTPKPLEVANKGKLACAEFLQRLKIQLIGYQFDASEEAYFYKEVKPFFYARHIYYTRMYRLEMQLSTAGPGRIQNLIDAEVNWIEIVYTQYAFIHWYLKGGGSHLDQKLFFHSRDDGAIAMYGPDLPADPAYPVCYDYAVAYLKAATMMLEHIRERVDAAQTSNVDLNLPRLYWTDSKTGCIELIYALHASKTFNNGKADIKDIVAVFEVAFHVKLGQHNRTFQEILARKGGYTTALDHYRNNLILRIDAIEEKYAPR